jgi:hypothetical protein
MLCLKLILLRCIVAPAPDEPSPFIVVGTARLTISSLLAALDAPEADSDPASSPHGAGAAAADTRKTGRRDARMPFGPARVTVAILVGANVFIFIVFMLVFIRSDSVGSGTARRMV